METQEQVVFPWQSKLEQRVSSCSALIVAILAASLIGMAITLVIWATLV